MTACARLPDHLHQFTLANGMRVVVVQDHRAAVVTHAVWHGIGSAHERPGKTGIAHFFEHLMFKGTDKYPSGEYDRTVKRMGGIFNAFTSYDMTAYYVTAAKANLEKVVELEADRMVNLRLTPEDVATELKVILEERSYRIDNDPTERFMEKFNHTHYRQHPYGVEVIGWRPDMEGLTREDALAWYKAYYAPDHAVAIFAGDVTVAEAKALAEKYYGPLPAQGVAAPVVPPLPAWTDGPQIVTVHDAEIQVPSVYVRYRAPSFFQGVAGAAANRKEVLALSLALDLLADGTRSYLYPLLVAEGRLADRLSFGMIPTMRFETYAQLYLQPAAGQDPQAVLAKYHEVLPGFAAWLTPAKLADEITAWRAQQIFARDNVADYAEGLAHWVILGGALAEYDQLVDLAQTLTVDDLRAAVAKYLVPAQATTGFLLPAAAPKAD